MLPHLLVMGGETPMTMARLGLARGQAGSVAAAAARSMERLGCRRRHKCLLKPPGLMIFDSDRSMGMEEEVCFPTDSREALSQGWQILVYNTRCRTTAYGYCTDSAPKAPTRTDGETSALWIFYVQARTETIMQGGDHFLVVADEAAYTNRGLWSSSVPEDRGDRRNFPGYKV